ncbi:MAG: hypothetical protein KME30_19015 [Iphinoe sp. HA4291-MV1]|jgi:hypothetical protein|nr:hypothetical protein [Iphinoe sp. HA4291-MV1]
MKHPSHPSDRPAFPSNHHPGLSKREYIAVQFMAVLMSDQRNLSETYSAIAKNAIVAADAFLAELANEE